MRLLCNIYIAIWVIYNLHWFCSGVVPRIDALSNILLAINLTLSGTLFLYSQHKYKNILFFKAVNILIILFTVYGLVSLINNETLMVKYTGVKIKNGTYLVAALRSFLPMYAFYLFAKMGALTEKMMKRWFFVFLIEVVVVYFLSRYSRDYNSLNEVFTNNSAYHFVSIFPFLIFFSKRPTLQYVLIAISLFFVLLGAKRGAILIFGIELVILFSAQYDKHYGRKKFYTSIAILLIGFLTVSTFNNLLSQSDRFQERVDATMEGNDSGRGALRNQLLTAFYTHSELGNLLFGFGADGSLKISTNFAHNDWVEMLIDQGFIGFLAYLFFWFAFLKTCRQMRTIDRKVYYVLLLLFVSGILKTLFSMWYSMVDVFSTMPLGYCLAIYSSKFYGLKSTRNKNILPTNN